MEIRMKTLADMTPGECIEYVGTWCEDICGDRYIFLGNTARDEETGAPMGSFLDTLEADIIDAPLAAFATRHDLPRAWTPDGDPPAGEWEEAEYLGNYKGLADVYHFDGDPTHRRWISEWEPQ